MINEIAPHRFDNSYIPDTTPGDHDFIFMYRDKSLLLKNSGDEIELPRKKDLPEITAATELLFLFTLDTIPCFLVSDALPIDRDGFIFKELGFFRTTRRREIAWTGITGFQLKIWYGQNRYCGSCGAGMKRKSDERALQCPDCSMVIYPKISPAIIVAILCNDKILLARNVNFPARWYSLIAGYIDIGESVEEAVAREVKEEVGLNVRNIRYIKSQSWPLSGSMMLGFVAEADATQPVVVDEKEIAEAKWFSRGNLPEHPPNVSISGELIEKFEKGEL
ncbi:MAG: NAD(+) diphosphatase [Chitinispirillaceae bacterium]|nr:NAD(+) diphosphatase [Chitinispirillaceae bacterium]